MFPLRLLTGMSEPKTFADGAGLGGIALSGAGGVGADVADVVRRYPGLSRAVFMQLTIETSSDWLT